MLNVITGGERRHFNLKKDSFSERLTLVTAGLSLRETGRFEGIGSDELFSYSPFFWDQRELKETREGSHFRSFQFLTRSASHAWFFSSLPKRILLLWRCSDTSGDLGSLQIIINLLCVQKSRYDGIVWSYLKEEYTCWVRKRTNKFP